MDLLDDPLISAEWLATHIDREDIKVLDGTWIMPGEDPDLPCGYIPGAQVFDIDLIADLSSPFKHMLPNADTFAAAVSKMGIRPSDHVVVYDRHGVRTSPRLWWTFQMFGHKKVSLLDGGLPAWIKAGQAVSRKPHTPSHTSQYKTFPPLSGVITQEDILALLHDNPQIADARSSGRFYGTEPEPRAGLRSGHIPGSTSLPYGTFQTQDGYFKPLFELADIVKHGGIELTRPIITTCGSGITAAGLAFNLYRLGARDIRVYDGSWTEWGASDAPVSLDKTP